MAIQFIRTSGNNMSFVLLQLYCESCMFNVTMPAEEKYIKYHPHFHSDLSLHSVVHYL